MTPPSSSRPPRIPRSGHRTDALVGGRPVAQSPEPGARSSDGDTGPVPIVGDRPGPPARAALGAGPDGDRGAPADDPAELPTTERPAGGRAGRNLGRRDRRRAEPRRGHRRLPAALAPGVPRRRDRRRPRRRRRAHPRPAARARFRAAADPAAASGPWRWWRWPGPAGRPASSSASCSPCSPSSCGGWPTVPPATCRDAASGVLVAVYVPLLAGFAILLLVPDDGAARVLAFIATVVASDVGGYAAGVLFGKHPMAPSISPKKSWEGMAGSVTACMIVATLHPHPRAGRTVVGRAGLRRGDGRLGDDRRPGGVADQARPRHQGHGQPAARATAG